MYKKGSIYREITLGLTWRDRKTEHHEARKTKVEVILATTKKRKWSRAGHIMRRNDSRWTAKVTQWNLGIIEIRNEGETVRYVKLELLSEQDEHTNIRQSSRWRGETGTFTGPRWTTLTLDREPGG